MQMRMILIYNNLYAPVYTLHLDPALVYNLIQMRMILIYYALYALVLSIIHATLVYANPAFCPRTRMRL
jgi:hypothetical protein